MKKVLIVFGTRPEAIKMAPVVKCFQVEKLFDTRVCVTAQHRGMLDQVLKFFEIVPNYDLDLMQPCQDLYDITSKVLVGMRGILHEFGPDLVLVHGDTSTTFASALAAFYQKIRVGHVEAGLRTGDIYSPWPEESNRKLTAAIATFHFAPTNTSSQNLLSENVHEENIIVTGNTVIDALLLTLERIQGCKSLEAAILDRILASYPITGERKIILITGHRRENFGQRFINICKALRSLAIRHPEMDFVYPVHLNPNVKVPANQMLGGISNIYLIDPLEYDAFVYLMHKSFFIITDSGGIQEEAPSLGKPVLVIRETTERPEAVEAGTVKMVGTNPDRIVKEAEKLIYDNEAYERISRAYNPYGRGDSSGVIMDFVRGRI